MAALARAIGVPNVELRASEDSAARGLMLTGLFPVPPYAPDGGYQIDSVRWCWLSPASKAASRPRRPRRWARAA